MNYYSNKIMIPEENKAIFENNRKQELTTLEKIGLEAILDDFVTEYETDTIGEAHSIKDYIRYNEDSVDILDGCTDTYIFDHYAIGDVWTTENGCILMTAVDLEAYTGDDPERFESSDLYELPYNFDLWSDFDTVLFRLD